MKKLFVFATALFTTAAAIAQPYQGEEPKIEVANAQQLTTSETNIVVFAKLEGADAKTASFRWEQISGPTEAKLKGANCPTLLAHRLRQGSYKFLIVANTPTGISSQEVTVNVVATPGDQISAVQ